MVYNARTHAVCVIQHGSDSIKPEAIKLVLLNPPGQVRQQEAQDLPPTPQTITKPALDMCQRI